MKKNPDIFDLVRNKREEVVGRAIGKTLRWAAIAVLASRVFHSVETGILVLLIVHALEPYSE